MVVRPLAWQEQGFPHGRFPFARDGQPIAAEEGACSCCGCRWCSSGGSPAYVFLTFANVGVRIGGCADCADYNNTGYELLPLTGACIFTGWGETCASDIGPLSHSFNLQIVENPLTGLVEWNLLVIHSLAGATVFRSAGFGDRFDPEATDCRANRELTLISTPNDDPCIWNGAAFGGNNAIAYIFPLA